MTHTEREARVQALALLLSGHTPEEVEVWLDSNRKATALSDPDNVQMEAVEDDARTG